MCTTAIVSLCIGFIAGSILGAATALISTPKKEKCRHSIKENTTEDYLLRIEF